MKYTIKPVPNPAFWQSLAEAPTAKSSTLELAPRILQLSHLTLNLLNFNALGLWRNNFRFIVPDTPNPIIGLQVLVTPVSSLTKTHRIFMAAMFSEKQGILFEITPLQLIIQPDGVQTNNGNNYKVLINSEIWKGDKEPIKITLTDPDTKSNMEAVEKENADPEKLPALQFNIHCNDLGTFTVNPDNGFIDAMKTLG